MRTTLWVSRVFLALAVVGLVATWHEIWSRHQKEVDRVRFVWGPKAKVPTFNPLDLFNYPKMNETDLANYMATGAFGILAFVFWLLSRRSGTRRAASPRRDRQSEIE